MHSIGKKTEHQLLNPAGNIVSFVENDEVVQVASLGKADFAYRFIRWVQDCQSKSWFPLHWTPEAILKMIGKVGDWQHYRIVTVVTEVFHQDPEDFVEILKRDVVTIP